MVNYKEFPDSIIICINGSSLTVYIIIGTIYLHYRHMIIQLYKQVWCSQTSSLSIEMVHLVPNSINFLAPIVSTPYTCIHMDYYIDECTIVAPRMYRVLK
jgi:hypothetical protein